MVGLIIALPVKQHGINIFKIICMVCRK